MPSELSIVIATCMRASSLDKTLASIAASAYPLDHVQVVIADNADDVETQNVCDRYAGRLELTYLVATDPGKNAALNAAIPSITGDLVLFTDDDVEVSPDWLAETDAAVSRWPKHLVFGGKVLPLWPSECPPHLNDRRYLGVCFTVLDPEVDEGPSFRFTPFGPNIAIRRSVFDAGVRFNPNIGPHRTSYIMGSETELIRRLKHHGHAPVYMPRSMVRHRIRAEQFSDRWLFGRAFRYGRLMAVRRQDEDDGRRAWTVRQLPDVVRCLVHAGIARVKRERKAWFDYVMELSTTCGMIYQSRQASPLQDEPDTPTMFAAPSNGLRA